RQRRVRRRGRPRAAAARRAAARRAAPRPEGGSPMTAAAESPAVGRPDDPTAHPRPGFARLLLSEWTKIRTVRSTLWSLILYVVLSLGFTTLLVSLIVAQWDDAPEGDRAAISADPVNFILGSGFFGQLV